MDAVLALKARRPAPNVRTLEAPHGTPDDGRAQTIRYWAPPE
jgi:hypothetical protein